MVWELKGAKNKASLQNCRAATQKITRHWWVNGMRQLKRVACRACPDRILCVSAKGNVHENKIRDGFNTSVRTPQSLGRWRIYNFSNGALHSFAATAPDCLCCCEGVFNWKHQSDKRNLHPLERIFLSTLHAEGLCSKIKGAMKN